MFSKAPIKRFNETTDDNPPPGAYDPKFNTDVADYSKGPDFDRQLINTTHAYSTNSNSVFSRPASRSSSRSGSRPGSQRGSRNASPVTSSSMCGGASLETADSTKVSSQVSSQQKLISLIHKPTGGFTLHSQDFSSRPKYLRSDPQHRIIQQATKATETNMNNVDIDHPVSTFDVMPETEGFQDRIKSLETQLSSETEKSKLLEELSTELKTQIRAIQLETLRPETSSVSTCTLPDTREKEILDLRDSHLRIGEKMSKLAEENERLQIERDLYKSQHDKKLAAYESSKTEIKFLQNKLDETDRNWKAAEEKCDSIKEALDEYAKIIQESSSSTVRECPLCKELSQMKVQLKQERERTEELNSQCEYVKISYKASKDEWKQKENAWNVLLKQRDKEIARLTTAIATSVKNVGEKNNVVTNQPAPVSKKSENRDKILQDIKNGNSHSPDSTDSTIFLLPCSLESVSDEDDDVFQLSPKFVSTTVANKAKNQTNILSPYEDDSPTSKESYLLKERDIIKKGMIQLASAKDEIDHRTAQLDANRQEAEQEYERYMLENKRLKDILSKTDMADLSTQFIKRKKIVPGNSEELDVDPFEFRRTDKDNVCNTCLSVSSSQSSEVKAENPTSTPQQPPTTSPSNETTTNNNKALNS